MVTIDSGTIDTASSEQDSGWDLYKRLLAYTRPHRLAIWLAILGSMIFSVTTTAGAWWLQFTVDAISSENFAELRIIAPLLCIVIAVVRGIGSFVGGYALAHIANHVIHMMRCQLIDRLVTLPATYFDANKSGRLVSRFTYDVIQVTEATSNAFAVLVREGFTVIGLLIYMMYIDWRLSLVFLLLSPMVGLVVSAASKRFRRYSTQMQDSIGEVTQISNETIKGSRVVKIFNAEHFVARQMAEASEANRRQNMKMAITGGISTPLVQFIFSISLALLVWMAMSPEFFAEKTSGQFVGFLTAAGLLARPIRQLTQVNATIQRGLAASKSIFRILDEQPEANTGTHRAERVQGRIEFCNVSFAYNDEIVALKDISFVAEPGQSIALVGRSGSGKSSLVSLIPRFYDYGQGSITLDGVELKDYELHNLRSHISLVSQQVVLFNGSIAENIAYGDAEIDRDRISKAAINAHAMEFIDQLERGLDTQVGDDAGLLSGGQRQRLAIARALLKDAPILIFDEATSALDSESEQHIQEALQTLMQGRTTFLIAHRLSTIENADLILVMHEGAIVESGSHSELLAQKGLYSKLHAIQFSESPDSSAE
ncbi:MAG: lipid A export permease/ATP-binding protein MsbA [Gammaproteobacteria bacterium]